MENEALKKEQELYLEKMTKNLPVLRASLRMSQRELAKKNRSYPSINDEHRNQTPPTPMVNLSCACFGISTEGRYKETPNKS